MKTVFLDLEKTIIYSWDDPMSINEDIIKDQLRNINPDRIGIYSFAIYTEEDKEIFFRTMKEEIENIFQCKIDSNLIFTVQEIADTIGKKKNQDVQSFIKSYGKQKSFQEFINQKFAEGEFILIDDLVDNLAFFENKLHIQFINPFVKVHSNIK